jgi:hypothetical protein
MHFELVDASGPVYGDVTLLAMRMRATNGISSDAATRIRAVVMRRLPLFGSGAPQPTTSPADAMIDIMTNTVYGAGRPLSELDLPEIQRISNHWAGQAHFNGGIVQKSTVWEALNAVLQTADCIPLPVGQTMSIAQEGVKAVRTQLFSDANMIRGSLAIGYTFDKPGDNDGIQVEYRDPATWNSLYVTWPNGAADPDSVELFGCTDVNQATAFARLLWQKNLMLRKTASFDTELEGMLARLGDRVGIATALPRWGKAGVVTVTAGRVLRLDDAPDWSGTGQVIVLRNEYGQPSDPIAVTPGDDPNEVVLASNPPFQLFGTGMQEPTHYAFGNTVEMMRDFIVSAVTPKGGAQVSVEAMVYDPSVFDNTLPWLQVPI